MYLITWAVFIALISSILWIGSYEEAQKLKQSIFISFFNRFFFFSILGLIGILLLILVNWIRNAIVFEGKINLQKLLVKGSIYVLISSFVGVLLFFILT